MGRTSAAGGGPGVAFKEAKVDDKIHTYTITPEEKQDLIAFLYSLTDEANLPEVPDKGRPWEGRKRSAMACCPALHLSRPGAAPVVTRKAPKKPCGREQGQ